MVMCRNGTEENKKRYESMKNVASKAVLKVMIHIPEEAPNV